MAKYPDISHYHPVEDWTKAKAACGFLVGKATQRTDYIDPTLDDFITGCEKNSIPYWLYAYLEKGSEKAQAEFLVKTCKGKVGAYFVGYALDIEADNAASDVQAALTYLDTVGTKTMVYINYSKFDTYKTIIFDRPANCAFWEARYGQNTGSYDSAYPCHESADLHQYTSKGSCDGISGNCDLNRITQTNGWSEDWFKTPLAIAKSTTTSKTSYSTGKVYKTQVDHLAVRTGAGVSYSKKSKSQLTSDGQAHAYSDGCLKKGTEVTCKAVKTVGSDIWIQIPSGWVAAYYNGEIYVQ